jgi:hypothetical protein
MDATQWAGVIAFGGAALTCFWVRLWPWIIIGTINLAMAIECGLGMRHRAHNLAIEFMGPLYANRVGVQIGLIFSAVFVVLVTASLLLHRKHWRVPAAVTTATALALALFSVETISLHAVDALLYQPVAGLLVIGWVWAALGSVTAIAAYRVMSRKGNLNT